MKTGHLQPKTDPVRRITGLGLTMMNEEARKEQFKSIHKSNMAALINECAVTAGGMLQNVQLAEAEYAFLNNSLRDIDGEAYVEQAKDLDEV